jgi:hypothetical protein
MPHRKIVPTFMHPDNSLVSAIPNSGSNRRQRNANTIRKTQPAYRWSNPDHAALLKTVPGARDAILNSPGLISILLWA